MEFDSKSSIETAVQAKIFGYQPVPIRDGDKRPYGSGWTHLRWETEEQVRTSFGQWAEQGAGGVGLLLGEPSGGLVDVDLDHPKAIRMRDYFLPPTPMVTGRPSRRRSHLWYQVDEDLPGNRKHKMPDGAVSVELRSSGSQTVIPPSQHPSDEPYLWEGEPFGGEEGPTHVHGRKLATQVALLGLGAVLLDAWPTQGGRHDSYLALAGGLLRYGEGVHPFWEKNLPALIRALADATMDDDGPEARVKEVMGTTLGKLRAGDKAVGFPKLAELIGMDHAEQARRLAREVEHLSGQTPKPAEEREAGEGTVSHTAQDDEELPSTLPPAVRNPLEERMTSWDQLDLEPYLSGQITMPQPEVLTRTDGKSIWYPGRVNMLYGKSEAAKSWIALGACVQEIDKGERVVYLDLEDEPTGTLARMQALGAGNDDIKKQFAYVRPESPLSEMQRNKFGSNATDDGMRSSAAFKAMLDRHDPTLIVADGMTVLYGLHGLDTNDATATDVLTTWLKSMTRGGRSTVVVIDHTGKGGGEGSSPIGAHHKTAMVQGTSIRADPIVRPMRGAVGTVRLVVFKDRPGAVREISSKGPGEQVVGTVTLDSSVEGVTRFKVDPPVEGDFVIGDSDEADSKLQEMARESDEEDLVMNMFEGDLESQVTTTKVVDKLHIPRNEVYKIWKRLTDKGRVERRGNNPNQTRFVLVDPNGGT